MPHATTSTQLIKVTSSEEVSEKTSYRLNIKTTQNNTMFLNACYHKQSKKHFCHFLSQVPAFIRSHKT